MELDFVRGIAILLVIDMHTPHSPLLPIFLWLGYRDHLGVIGVDIFFVLSGFLVGGLLMKEWKVRRGIDSKRFLIRRGFKIWPLYYLFVFTVWFAGRRTLAQIWGNLLNIQNYAPGIQLTWSLAIEEHVYLLLTLCLAIAARRKASTRNLFYFILAVCLAEIPIRYLMMATGHEVFLPTHARVDSIGWGVLLAMIFHFAPDRFARMRDRTWIWWSCILVGMLVTRISLPRWWMVPPLHDAATLIAIGTLMVCYRPLAEGKKHGWLYRFVAWVGLYSYGIYLWHMPTIAPVGAWGKRHPAIPGAALCLLMRGIEIAAGYSATRLIELPMLRLRDRFFPKRVDSAVGPPALVETADPAGTVLTLA